ncbi:hypothetical protein ILYODFUR_033092 [Ilyodon furcidens]|uniref:Uncharacterized protein n=1 Tax=Ilyodon furcidens TaxID=33524 RepID=A0ABV0TZV8_9TELE
MSSLISGQSLSAELISHFLITLLSSLMFNKANKSIVICLFQGRVTRAAAWVRKPRYPFQQPTLPAPLGERQDVPRPTNYYYYLQVHGFKQHLSFTATLLSQTLHGEDQQHKKNSHLNRTVCSSFAPVILCTYSTCSCFFALFSAAYLESLKIRSIVSPRCPGSSLGSPPSWTCPVLLPGDASAGYPYQMPKPPELAPVNVEEQQLYSKWRKPISMACICDLIFSVHYRT